MLDRGQEAHHLLGRASGRAEDGCAFMSLIVAEAVWVLPSITSVATHANHFCGQSTSHQDPGFQRGVSSCVSQGFPVHNATLTKAAVFWLNRPVFF